MSRIRHGNSMAGKPGYHYSRDALRQNIPQAAPLTPEMVQKAKLVVCANAHDSVEAAMFLNMLGIGKE